MSNFTTFFPSAGGGGGEGSGINSYAPFLVGTTDNNPQGYIHSTGVYTNPVDSSVWLKTGNRFIDSANAYPNAISELSHYISTAPSSTQKDDDIWSDIAYDGTDVWSVEHNGYTTKNRLYPIDEATGVWGSLVNKDNDQVSGSFGNKIVAWDSTASALITSDITSGGNVINRWNSAFTSISSTFSIYSSSIQQLNCSSYDATNNYLYVLNAANVILAYDLSTETYANITFSATSASGLGTVDGIAVHPTSGKLWAVSGSIIYELNPTTGVKTGTQFNLYPNAYLSNGYVRGITWKDADTLLAITQQSSSQSYVLTEYDKDGSRVVGDATARTDSSGSGQPLFIKLK